MTTPFAFTYIDVLTANDRSPTIPAGSALNTLEKNVNITIPNTLVNKAAYLEPKALYITNTTQVNRPTAAMTANTETISGIQYVAVTSGPNATGQPYQLFDDVTTTDYVVGDGYIGGNNTTGGYNGSIQTIDKFSGAVYGGAYVQLQCQTMYKIDSITLNCTSATSRPKSIAVFGTNNTYDLFFIQQFNDITWSSNTATISLFSTNVTYFHYRIVILEAGQSGNNTTTAQLSDVNIVGRVEGATQVVCSVSHNFQNYNGLLDNSTNVPSTGGIAQSMFRVQKSGKSQVIGVSGNNGSTRGPQSFARIPILCTDENTTIIISVCANNLGSLGTTFGCRMIYQFNIIPIE